MDISLFRLDTSPYNEETKAIAEKELRETPENVETGLTELRRLLSETPDLYYDANDESLLIFLRPCKFYADSALKMMRRVAEFKRDNISILRNLMPEDERTSFVDNDVVNVLTNRDQLGRRVLIVNCGGQWDPKRVSADQLFRIFYLVHVAAQVEPTTQVHGVVVIMDFDGMGMKQVRGLSPTFSRRLLTFIQDAMPLRLKEVHMVNQPYVFNMVWTLFKPFVKEKLNKRMFFHGKDRKSLHKHLDPDYLPSNYGGNKPAINYGGKEWFECVKEHETHIAKWNTMGFADSN